MLSLWSRENKRCSEEPILVNFLACVAKYKSHIREGGLALVPSWWWIWQLVMFLWQQKCEVIAESSAGQAVPHTTCPAVTYVLKVPKPPSAEDQVLKALSLCWTFHIQIITWPKLGEAETEMSLLNKMWVSVCDMGPNDSDHSDTVKVFIKRNKRGKNPISLLSQFLWRILVLKENYAYYLERGKLVCLRCSDVLQCSEYLYNSFTYHHN